MKIRELEEILPRLNETARDVDSWGDEFARIMRLANITEPMNIHSWAMECVEGKLRGILQDLVTTDEEGGKKYPSIDQMKKAIEDALEVTPQEKCKRLQKLRIRKGESIQNFNWRYKKLYNSLSKLYQSFITVDDYIESIASRPYARSQVITQRCYDLEDAFEEAELAERAEENFLRKPETVLATFQSNQPYYYKVNYGGHPFKGFGNRKYNTRDNDRSDYRYVKENKLKSNQELTRRRQDNSSTHQQNNRKCYKCGQVGHYLNQCPYSFRELAEMEEKGQLQKENKSLNW